MRRVQFARHVLRISRRSNGRNGSPNRPRHIHKNGIFQIPTSARASGKRATSMLTAVAAGGGLAALAERDDVALSGEDGQRSSGNSTYMWYLGGAAVLALGAGVVAMWPESSTADITKKAKQMIASHNGAAAERILREALKNTEIDSAADVEDALCALVAAIMAQEKEDSFPALDAVEQALSKRMEGQDSAREETKYAALQSIVQKTVDYGGDRAKLAELYASGAEKRMESGDVEGALEAFGRSLSAFGDAASDGTQHVLGKIHRVLHGSANGAASASTFDAAIVAVAVGLGPTNPTVALVMRDAAQAHFAAGAPERARELLLNALEIQESSLSSTDPEKANTMVELGKFYMYVDKKPSMAVKIFREASVMLSVELGSGHPRVESVRQLERAANDMSYS